LPLQHCSAALIGKAWPSSEDLQRNKQGAPIAPTPAVSRNADDRAGASARGGPAAGAAEPELAVRPFAPTRSALAAYSGAHA
jgi:hypothetical protein